MIYDDASFPQEMTRIVLNIFINDHARDRSTLDFYYDIAPNTLPSLSCPHDSCGIRLILPNWLNSDKSRNYWTIWTAVESDYVN